MCILMLSVAASRNGVQVATAASFVSVCYAFILVSCVCRLSGCSAIDDE